MTEPSEPGEEEVRAGEAKPDIEALIARLRARVEARRSAGEYPGHLEEVMTAHFRRIVHQRREPRPIPDLMGPIGAAGKALPIQATKIPLESDVPGGRVLHTAIARVVGRQIRGALQQVQAFAQPVHAALEALTGAVEELNRTVNVDVAQSLDALYERQAAQERLMAQAASADRRARDADRGDTEPSWEDRQERSRELAERLVGADPVFELGRHVEEKEALAHLRTLDDKALGGVIAVQAIHNLSPQEVLEFVALAADKVRPGGRVFVEVSKPQSLYAFAHPAFLMLLFRDAGFSEVDIDVPFAEQSYLIVATR